MPAQRTTERFANDFTIIHHFDHKEGTHSIEVPGCGHGTTHPTSQLLTFDIARPGEHHRYFIAQCHINELPTVFELIPSQDTLLETIPDNNPKG